MQTKKLITGLIVAALLIVLGAVSSIYSERGQAPSTIAKKPKPSAWRKRDTRAARAKLGPASVLIQSRINKASWQKHTAIYPLKKDRIVLKVDEVAGASIKWYQISADLSKIYKNANHPWEKDPYKWAGFGKIGYLLC